MTGYDTIQLCPIAGALGCRDRAASISRAPSRRRNSQRSSAHFLEHLVIFFHDQVLTPEQHEAFQRHASAR